DAFVERNFWIGVWGWILCRNCLVGIFQNCIIKYIVFAASIKINTWPRSRKIFVWFVKPVTTKIDAVGGILVSIHHYCSIDDPWCIGMHINATPFFNAENLVGVNNQRSQDNIGQVIHPGFIGSNFLIAKKMCVLTPGLQLNPTICSVVTDLDAIPDNKWK